MRAGAAGRKIGYRTIKGGRALRVPLFEVVDRMDLTNMPIEVQVQGAYSKGGTPLNVHGIANVKIAGEQPVLDNAIERFLGVPRDKIMAVAKETLEGNLRGVLATLTPEEVNEDKIKFAQSLLNVDGGLGAVHAAPAAHPPHSLPASYPPQSTPVSLLFWSPSRQVAGTQRGPLNAGLNHGAQVAL